MRHGQSMDSLEARIGYEFRDRALLKEALTHPSVRYEKRAKLADNQRLEFLGDAVLQLVLSEVLFKRLPDSDEGLMTKLRTRLVSERALAKMARAIGLGPYLILGKSVEITGGRERGSTLSDALEALMGAIYLDGSFEAAERFILQTAGAELEAVMQSPVDVNPKGELQELLQGALGIAPRYVTVQEEGPAHERIFRVVVFSEATELGHGKGLSKKEAEIEAARSALAGSKLQQIMPRAKTHKANDAVAQ
jgi:ribonuclease-3